jgi:hypothetical protein
MIERGVALLALWGRWLVHVYGRVTGSSLALEASAISGASANRSMTLVRYHDINQVAQNYGLEM